MLLAILAGCATTGSPVAPPAGQAALRVATFNLLHATPSGRGYEDWLRRKGSAAAIIGELDADILALQEVETIGGSGVNIQLDWLKSQLPHYGVAAVGDAFPSTQPILYRRDRLDVIEQGFYFHTAPPGTVRTRTPDGNKNTYTSWTTFRDRRDGAILHLHNSHFDHLSGANRMRAAQRTVEEVRPLFARGEAVMVIRDFNVLAASPTMAILRSAPLALADTPGPTFHLGTGIGLFPAIDHLLYSAGIEPVAAPLVLRRNYDGVVPSDHHPVALDVRLIGRLEPS